MTRDSHGFGENGVNGAAGFTGKFMVNFCSDML